jgi:hypothetical protein
LNSPVTYPRWHRLARLNRTHVFVGALVVVLAGLFLPGVAGALILVMVAAALASLLVKTSRVTAPLTVGLRVVLLAGLVLLALHKIGWV